MDIINLLRKFESYLQIKNRSIYSMSAVKQKEYLESLPEPKDEIDRSYYQYLCQRKLAGDKTSFILKYISYIPYLLFMTLYRIKKKPRFSKHCNAVFLPDGKPDNIIPNSLKGEFGRYEFEKEKQYYLTSNDIAFLKQIKKRYSNDGMFLLKIMVKVARYRYLIDIYKPKALIVCNEYSFTSSVMKIYCNRNNIELINVMHGEKLYAISDSFFKFDRCYIWNEYYKKLFISLRADEKQFIIDIPDSMSLVGYENVRKTVDYTYYLADENAEQLDKIITLLTKLNEKGYVVAIRSHPRYTDVLKVKNILLKKIQVEDPRELTIQESLARTYNAISFVSTVLNQAYANSINVIIDDMVRPNEFKKLKEQQYIMLNLEHKLLSDIID